MNRSTIARPLARKICLFVIATLLGMLANMSVPPPVAHADTITVNTTDDVEFDDCNTGNCTLREAIAGAVSGDVIEFNLAYPATITLNGAELGISGKNITINQRSRRGRPGDQRRRRLPRHQYHRRRRRHHHQRNHP